MDEMQRDFYTKTEVNNKFGGMVLLKISKADFDELETKDPDTIYYVYDDSGKVTQYVGDSELSRGGAVITGVPVVQMGGTVLPISSTISGIMGRVD